jgi:hypothetical protein
MMNHSNISNLRFIVVKQDEYYAAQCVEKDIGTQAKTIEQLQKRIHVLIKAYVAESARMGVPPLSNVKNSPKHYEEIWKKRSDKQSKQEKSENIEFEYALCA